MDIWRSLVSIILLIWTITHKEPGLWLFVAEMCKLQNMEVEQHLW